MTINNEYNEDRRRWRAITFDYDVVEAQEELSGTFHCLSATTRMLVMSMLPYVSWPTRYDGSEMDKDKIFGWYEKAVDELGGDMIRQNPANPCQMQMSCDGVTWTTVMDYSICLSPTTPTQAASYDLELTDNIATYSDDISNLTDKWDYDGTYPTGQTNEALCWAILEYVRMVCAAQVVRINEKNEEKNFYQELSGWMGLASGVAALMAAAGVFALSAATGGAALALGAAILAMSGEYDDKDPALYEDTDTIDAIACEILGQMRSTKPTFIEWSTALTGDTSEPVNDYVYDTMQSEDLFMQFLFLVADMVVAAETHELECPCMELDWEMRADLDVTTLPDFVTVVEGTHNPALGILFACYGAAPVNKGASINVTIDPTHVVWFSVGYRYSLGTDGGPSDVQAGNQGAVDGEGEVFNTWYFGQVPINEGSLNSNGDWINTTILNSFLRSSRGNCTGTGELKYIKVGGTGTNPFDGATGWVGD